MNKPLLFLSLMLGLVCSVAPAHALRTDTVTLINGNAVTGEIDSLDLGKLSYATDSMGTVQIDWEDVVSLESNQSLQVELSDGRRFYGSLRGAEERFRVSIELASRAETIDLATYGGNHYQDLCSRSRSYLSGGENMSPKRTQGLHRAAYEAD